MNERRLAIIKIVNVNVNVIYLLSTIIKHYKAACTINELDSKAALLHLQLPTN